MTSVDADADGDDLDLDRTSVDVSSSASGHLKFACLRRCVYDKGGYSTLF